MVKNDKIDELKQSYLMKKSAILKYLKLIVDHPLAKDAEEDDIYECLEKVVSVRSSQMEKSSLACVRVLTTEEIVEIAVNETFVPNTKEPMEYIEEDSVNLINENGEFFDEEPFIIKIKKG
ncbi:MAG: hypothetical protein E7157_00645 [Lactobacillales bacterium]|nr:hypothetical protein [Lactobacillales bacterium]